MSNQAGLRARIRTALAQFVFVAADQIDEARDFTEYGLGSAEAALFIGEIERGLGRDIPPMLVYDHPTVASLADAIEAMDTQGATVVD